MSIDEVPYVVTYQTLLQAHLQKLLQNRQVDTAPVSEANCQELLSGLRDEREQWLQQDSLPEPRAHFPPFEAVARDIYTNLITGIDISDPAFLQVWILLDVLNVLTDNEICEPALSFWLIEELLDSQTIDGCRKVFDYLESRRERMIAKFFKEKNLVILRCCNELLRRLSRAEDTVFCGRVFIFLFQTFPLGDKSSVNLRGEFHQENATSFDPVPSKSDDAIKPMEIDSDAHLKAPSEAPTPASTAPDIDSSSKTGRSTPVPRSTKQDNPEAPPDLDTLYPKFWGLQSLFSSPTRLFDPSSMAQLKEGLNLTLACFRSISNSTTSTSSLASSRKRKASEMNGAAASTPFNPKYLTNRDLFDLEIHDLAFRRHILVQSLIMLDFLLSLSPTSKLKSAGLTNKSVLYLHTLSDDDTKWCIQTRSAIATYLQQQGSGNEGKMYYRMVDTVLSRDKNWVRWKGESCPPITREAVDVQTYLSAQDNLLKITADANRPLTNPPGASDFDFLLKETSMESLKHPRRRYKIPTLEEYYKSIEMDDLDMDFATDQEKAAIEERKQGKVWRALRASVLEGKRFKLAEDLDGGTNYKALIGETVKKEGEVKENVDTNGDGEVKKEESETKGAISLDGQNDQHLTDVAAPKDIKDEEAMPDAPAVLNPDAAEFMPSNAATPIPSNGGAADEPDQEAGSEQPDPEPLVEEAAEDVEGAVEGPTLADDDAMNEFAPGGMSDKEEGEES